jgi:hypothetical protein
LARGVDEDRGPLPVEVARGADGPKNRSRAPCPGAPVPGAGPTLELPDGVGAVVDIDVRALVTGTMTGRSGIGRPTTGSGVVTGTAATGATTPSVAGTVPAGFGVADSATPDPWFTRGPRAGRGSGRGSVVAPALGSVAAPAGRAKAADRAMPSTQAMTPAAPRRRIRFP